MAQGAGLNLSIFRSCLSTRLQQMTLAEAQTLVLRVLKQVMEEKLDHHNVQLAQVCCWRTLAAWLTLADVCKQVTKDAGFEILDEKRLKDVIDAM